MTTLILDTARGARAHLPPAAAWVALALFCLFALLIPRFATPGNLENVLRVAAILAIVSCGQAIVIVLGGIEFSFGASVALASVATVLALPSLGTVGAFAVGAAVVIAVGAFNGTLVACFKLPPFIVTLGSLMVVSGLAATLAGGLPIDAPASAAFSWPARGRVLGVAAPILAAGVALLALHLLLARSRLGRIWYLAGSNPNAAHLAGLRASRAVFLGYVAAGCFCALGAVILTSRVASGQPSLAPNLPFETIAACAIGGLPLAGGQGRTSQVICGVLVIAMMNNAIVLLNLAAAFQLVAMAAIIIGAVLLQKSWPSIVFAAGLLRPGRRS